MYATLPGKIVCINTDTIKSISIGNGNTTKTILETFEEPTTSSPRH